MGQTGRDRRFCDSLSVLLAGMRQMGRLGVDDVMQAMAERTRRRRGQTSAEWRRERRLIG